jgi:XrtN system VIT domain protein
METLTEPLSVSKLPAKEQGKFGLTDGTTLLGYLLLAISAALYGLEEYYDVSRGNDNFTIFFIHYFISIVYLISLIIGKSFGIRRSWQKKQLQKTIILLHLFLVSAYALNREVSVFEDSVPWLCVFLLLVCAVMLSYHYFDRLPKAINYVQHILLGSGLVLYLYMTIYVANFYMLGALGLLLFGIGGHIFVPIFLLFSAIRILTTNSRIGIGWVIAGVIIPIFFAVSFISEWNGRVKAIDRLANQSVIHAEADLPAWVKVAQSVKNDWITERILKSKLVYTVSNNHFQWELFPVDSNWDEKRKHDPFVFLASTNNTSLSEEDRKNILKALTNNRHRAQERLWSGDNLSTAYIVTDVEIYPELRLAYSEQFINIRNNAVNNNRWWGNSEEAIYTFQLPEGSVVTSLSLWVNGKEQKALLTSKQKATEAYTTIVGRESRDPSVVHWQEGNTVSVRVFPCTPEEERKFKLGITSPLPVTGGHVIYKNVTFRGPDASAATQTSRIRIIGTSENLDLPDIFKKNINGEYMSEGKYDPDLAVAMDVSPIKANQFSFDGFQYSLLNSDPEMSDVEFADVYLDLNNSWTSREINSLYPLLKNYDVYAHAGNDFVLMSPESWEDVTNELRQRNFSLFPFHRIKGTDTALVITKGKELSPYLRDFKTSSFAEGISKFFASGRKVNVFNLEGMTSTYIKSLKELRALNFARGNTDRVLTLLKNKTFPLTRESEERIVLHESDMVIEKKVMTDKNLKDNAPDHLARLFAYNNIMRQVGANFFKDEFVNEKLVDEAATAYVVSPVSSLIVLETEEDYKRFGIKDKDNSLHNATKNSSGAVPEPHEWALIIVFLLFIAFQVLRYSKSKVSLVKK